MFGLDIMALTSIKSLNKKGAQLLRNMCVSSKHHFLFESQGFNVIHTRLFLISQGHVHLQLLLMQPVINANHTAEKCVPAALYLWVNDEPIVPCLTQMERVGPS